jgi:hypothetical protein
MLGRHQIHRCGGIEVEARGRAVLALDQDRIGEIVVWYRALRLDGIR